MAISGARAHPPRHAMGEFRTVEDDQNVRVCGDDGIGGFGDTAQNFRQAHRDGEDADDGEVAEWKQTWHALRRHLRAADAGKPNAAAGRTLERGDQRRAKPVAGFLACCYEYMQRRRVHGAEAGATPTTKMPARSAARTSFSGSAKILSPAATAIPSRPARATPSTVCGPIDGRSKRRSCPGFGAFTRTPLPAAARNRPLARKSAIRASI